jgi:copper(I)-binding protein
MRIDEITKGGWAAALVVGLNVAVAAQGPAVSASAGWVKLPSPGETTASAFAEIENPTAYDVYLVSADADAAAKVEYREMGAEGVTKAQPLKSVTVPAYGSFSLQPKGTHLVLTDLKRTLKEGETVALTLRTSDGVELKVAAIVRKE